MPYILTREPGGTQLAEDLRKIILSSKKKIDTNMEILLLMSSRLDHLNKIIKPGLKKNKIVICDRFVDSTAIYQGYFNKFGINNIYKLHKILLGNFLPDITFFFNSKPEIIKMRLMKRKNKNKYDILDHKFNKKINDGYLKLAKKKKRFIIINASLSKTKIHDIITQNILKKISSNGIRKSKNK